MACVAILGGCAHESGLAHAILDRLPEPEQGTSTFALTGMGRAEWERYLVACPYDTTESIEQRLGFAWSDAPDLSLSDDRQVVVLVGGGDVIEVAEVPRDQLDLCSGDPWALRQQDEPIAISYDAPEGRWVAVR